MMPAWKRREVFGDATLYLGDALEVMAEIPKVDAVVTDPPYGVGLVTKTSDYRGSDAFDNGESLKASTLYQDDPEHVRDLLRKAIPACIQASTRAAIFSGSRMMWEYPAPSSVGGIFTPNGAGRDRWGFGCFHPVLFYGGDPYLSAGMGSRPNAVKQNQPNIEKIDHPCPKPLPWMMWLVYRASLEAETILDPFMGSGTTGVACMNLGRRFYGIEIEERYFDIACRRIDLAARQERLNLGEA